MHSHLDEASLLYLHNKHDKLVQIELVIFVLVHYSDSMIA